jgi:hypothetical protein
VASPSANLHVAGNIIATDLHISQGIFREPHVVTGHITLNTETLVFVDSSTDVATIALPNPTKRKGGSVEIKQTKTPYPVVIVAGGNNINDSDMLIMDSGNLSGASFTPDGSSS